LRWKLDDLQKKIYDQFYDDQDDITTMLIARQTGKSYLLALLSCETCLKKPDAVVKFVTPKLKMVKNILNKNMKVILKDCPIELRPEWKEADKVWRFPNGSEIQAAGSDNQNYDNIRGGTCLDKQTKILTKSGIKEVQDIQKGDILYGYNEDGGISETKVLANKYMGKQKVTEMVYKAQSIGAFTDNHPFLVNSISSVYRGNPKNVEKTFGEINPKNSYIVREFVSTGGDVDEPHAYAIGAFIGDGCKLIGNQLRISSKDERVPNKVAETIEYNVVPSGKWLYYFTDNTEYKKHSSKVTFNYYDKWLRNYDYLEKNFDYEIVNTWNRESCLKLLAGLHDTNGNLHVRKDHCVFEYTSCNLDLIKNINKLILKLFQVEGHIKTDNRSKVPCYKLKISSNMHVSRIVSELKPYSALDYKVNIDKLYASGENRNAARISKGKSYISDTYDLIVDNDTGYYLTAHGMVTHNCDLWIVDEAGFCNELEEVVYSVLIPTTTTTGGTGLLSSTPDPKNPDHDFIKLFVEPAEIENRLFKYTIDDNVRLTDEEVAKIVSRYPDGRKNPRFRAEYLCEIVRDIDSMVLGEFDAEAQAEIITDQFKIPKFYDYYMSMDIGGKDFTVILVAYYDFINGQVVVLDEIVIKDKQNTANIAKRVKEKQEEHFGEKPPYLMFADNNNVILLNDLQLEHQLYFIATRKDNKEAAINNVRLKIMNRDIVIHPRCKTLIAHMKNATWEVSSSRKGYREFSRSSDHGHYDAVDALIYLIRNIVYGKNPYPNHYGALTTENHHLRVRDEGSKGTIARIFKGKKN